MNKLNSNLINSGLFFSLFFVFFLSLPTLDYQVFCLLNGHLNFAPAIHLFVLACLNHELENYFNLGIIFGSFFIGKPKENYTSSYIGMILGAILWYEVCFYLVSKLEHQPYFLRTSPSFDYLIFNLNDVVPFKVKIFAPSCFPSGHAMTLGYWNALSQALFKKSIKKQVLILSVVGCLPRLIAGAHWLTDVLTGYILGQLFFACYQQIINMIKRSSEELPRAVA